MKIWVFIFFLILKFQTAPLFAEDAGTDASTQITRLIEQVDQLEKNQQEILVAQNKILDEIKNLKVQSRR